MAKSGKEDLELRAKAGGHFDASFTAPFGFIIRTSCPERVVKAEILRALGQSGTAKLAKGLDLTPEESAVISAALGRDVEKMARVATVVEKATKELERRPLPQLPPGATEAQAPNQKWRDHFVAAVELESDDAVQELWAKILAGEYRSPGKYSLRTLTVLRDLDGQTAAMFLKVLRYSLFDRVLIPSLDRFAKAYTREGILYKDFIALQDCGLVSLSDTMIDPRRADKPHYYITHGRVAFRGDGMPPNMYTLTASGIQLAQLADLAYTEQTIAAIGNWLSCYLVKLEFALVPIDIENPDPDYLSTLTFRPWEPSAITCDAYGHPRISEESHSDPLK